jgi:hypothetical protein
MSNCPSHASFSPFAPAVLVATASRLKHELDARHDRLCDGSAL